MASKAVPTPKGEETSAAMSDTTTRERILAAVRTAMLAGGVHVTMAEIAKVAGVSRQAVYLQFGDRIGLLAAFIGNQLTKIPTRGAQQAALDLPPLEAFEGFFRNWIRTAASPELQLSWRQVQNEPQLLPIVKRNDKRFFGQYIAIFERLQEAGFLRPIWTAKEAADAAYQTTMYGVFIEYLRNMRNWEPEDIEERGMKVLRATFLTDNAAKRAAKIQA